MARKCTCKLCKNKLTTDVAYKIINGKTNTYYCSQEEYENFIKDGEKKNSCFETIAAIMQIPVVTPVMKKEVNKLNNYYDYIVIERTFKECENNIRWFLNNKDNSSEYGKTKYIITVVSNNINAVQKKYIQELKELERLFHKQENNNIDVDIMNISEEKPKVKTKNDISDFLS